MGTGATKIGSIIEYIKNSYKRLGEYDVEEIDIKDFTSNDISGKDYASLKKALDEVEEMERGYYAIDKNTNNIRTVINVSNNKGTSELTPTRGKAKPELEKDRED